MATGSVPITAGSGTPIRIVTNAGVDAGADQQVFSLADSAGNLLGTAAAPVPAKLGDGTNSPSVKAASTAAVAADPSLVVALHPSSPLPAGANSIGSIVNAAGTAYMGQVRLTDGTNNPAVKAASTAAAATDPSLVVALHPTSPLPAGTQAIGSVSILDGTTTGAMTNNDSLGGTPAGAGALISTTPSVGSAATWNVSTPNSPAYSTFDVQLTGSFGGGTVYFEGSLDGTNWFTVNVIQLGNLSPSSTFSTTTAGVYRGTPAGQAYLRTRVVGATGPSISVSWRASLGGSVVIPMQAPSGAGFTVTSAASTNATSVKAVPTSLYELTLSNPTATPAYVKLYNKASAPTVGTDVPVATFRVAATGSAGDLLNLSFGELGKRFSLGVALAITAAAVSTDTAVAVAGVQVSGTTA